MEKKTIGSFIAALRKASGLTQRELAEKLNVSDKAVSRWERDESAPDLSLIPVIAEIFGVTSDELLRGQRVTEAAAPVRSAAKTEKQIQNILNRALTRYKICSIISVAVAFLGILAAMVLNLGFLRAYVGFFVGCAFFIGAAVCQCIFLILGRSAIRTEEIPEAATEPVRKAMVLGAELVFGIIYTLLALCLPLIVLPVGTFRGLTAVSWAKYGAIFGLLSAVLWLICCTVFNTRKGYRNKTDWKSPKNKLRLRWLRKGAVLALTLVLLHAASISLLSQNYHLLVKGQSFQDWTSFRRFMETPTDTDGTPLIFVSVEGAGDDTRFIYENQNGSSVVFNKGAITRRLYATVEDEQLGNEPLVRYRHMNKQISSIRLNHGGLPVQAFTQRQMQAVEIITIFVNLLWCGVYLAALRRTIRKYRTELVNL